MEYLKKEWILFGILFFMSLTLVSATAPPPSPNCYIEGIISSVVLREAYNESCVAECPLSLECCPTDMELIHPARYYLNLTINSVSYVSGDSSYRSCEQVFIMGNEITVWIEKNSAINGIPQSGKFINGTATSFFPSFLSYTLNGNEEIDDDEVGVCGDGTCNGNETVETCPDDCVLPECQNDTLICNDGGVFNRDPTNSCDFPECPPGNFPCTDFCGDGGCEQDTCQGDEGCPCWETPESCPGDCVVANQTGGFSLNSLLAKSYFWIVLSVIGAILFIIIGLKILKWLFWILALVLIALAVVFWFVL